jgi:hypothetical protein
MPKIHHPGRANNDGCQFNFGLFLWWVLAIPFSVGLFVTVIMYAAWCSGKKEYEDCDEVLGYLVIFGIGAAIARLPCVGIMCCLS